MPKNYNTNTSTTSFYSTLILFLYLYIYVVAYITATILINHKAILKKIKKKNRIRNLTPASGDGTASTAVGVGLSASSAIVIRSTASGARDSVLPQRTVADVPPRS